jgi:hypothetical protein
MPTRPTLALFCSTKCPGKLILDAYDACRHLRGTRLMILGGFHSPMEQECLRILLRGTAPLGWCLARGNLARVPPTYREAVRNGLLKIVAPFSDKITRPTAATCAKRNRMVADQADAILIIHAAPGSKVETLALSLLAAGRPVYTFDHPANAALLAAGARAVTPDTDWTALLRGQTR